jgi:hypothetical protein
MTCRLRNRAGAALLAALACSGCDPPTRDAAPAPPVRPAVSPAEAAQRLGDLHRRRAYDQIGELIVPDRQMATVRLLEAVDEVIDAHRRLRQVAEERYGVPAGDAWGLGTMENNLGVFSERTVVITQRFTGDQAEVTLQEADYLPLVHAAFEWHDGRWLLRPEATPARMVTELSGLARIIRGLCREAEAGAGFEAFADAFVERVPPQMRRVMLAGDSPGAVAAGSAAE